MAVRFISVKCPECGANLPMEEGRKEMFCSYCGTRVIMSNDNEHIYRHIDEAAIKKAEAEKEIKKSEAEKEIKKAEAQKEIAIKRMEYAEKKRLSKEKHKRNKVIISIIIGILAVLFVIAGSIIGGNALWVCIPISFFGVFAIMLIWIVGNAIKDDDVDYLSFGQAKVPEGIDNYGNKPYRTIESILKGAGFTNISCVPHYHLWARLYQDLVESITINGETDFRIGQVLPSNAPVVITYHSKKR